MAFNDMTDEQRAAALEKAKAVRAARSELTKKLKAGEVSPDSVLEKRKEDPMIGKTKVLSFLKSLPGIGISRATQFMEENDIDANKRLRGLTKAQTDAVLEFIQK